MLEVEFVRRLIASGFVERLFVDFRKAEAGDGTDRVRFSFTRLSTNRLTI